MDLNSVTQIAYYSAAVLSLFLTIAFVYQHIKNRLPWSLSIAVLVQTFWLACLARQAELAADSLLVIFQMEAMHYIAWAFAITRTTTTLCTSCLPKAYGRFIYAFIIAAIVFTGYVSFAEVSPETLKYLIFWQGIIYPVIGLLGVEQLYRNNTHYRIIKLLCLILAASYVFDAYLFTQDLLFSNFDEDLWQARAAVVMASSVLMVTGLVTISQPTDTNARITFSRPAIFYTSSLTIAGVLLTILSFGGYYVHLYGGSWGTVIYTIMLVFAIIFIGAILISRAIREKLSVQINKHLFSYKYDYRTEWIKLINHLSQSENNEDPLTRSIRVATELFKCDGGAIWLNKSNSMTPIKSTIPDADLSKCVVLESSDFCDALKEEWIFSPRSLGGDLSQFNELLPRWAHKIPNIQIIMPLLTEKDLAGFMVLTSRESTSPLNWEDLDLIKTVGRQFASYVKRHEQAEMLTEVRQFEAFNKLSAFVMHDLKNLIAQQSLVVKNAEKHKDNPAFVDDAMNTIHNSVERMNNLLRKLQHNEPDHAKSLVLKDVFVEAVKRCQKRAPAPSLTPIDANTKVTADFDSLVMVFTHIIHNAQDATPENGFIDVVTEISNGFAIITIEDNGSGMTEEFIQEKLFKPFETTKSGKGMGVGVYQAKEYVTSLGGTIAVDSTPKIGTTFTITIPIQ